MSDENSRSPAAENVLLFLGREPYPEKPSATAIRMMVDALLKILDEQFNRMYSAIGRRSTAPERLLRAPLLQSLYSIRSERALMEHIDFDILFRWFIDLHLDEPVWDHSSFPKIGAG